MLPLRRPPVLRSCGGAGSAYCTVLQGAARTRHACVPLVWSGLRLLGEKAVRQSIPMNVLQAVPPAALAALTPVRLQPAPVGGPSLGTCTNAKQHQATKLTHQHSPRTTVLECRSVMVHSVMVASC